MSFSVTRIVRICVPTVFDLLICVAVVEYLKSERDYMLSHKIVAGFQSAIMTGGLLAATSLAIYQVMHGTKTVGDFIILLTYWSQLSGTRSSRLCSEGLSLNIY